jgi:hypothetical protein
MSPRRRDEARYAEAVRLYTGLPGGEGLTVRQVAARVPADEKTVRRWLAGAGALRAPGPRRRGPARAARQRLTGEEEAELRAMWSAVPVPARGGPGHDLASVQGRQVLALLGRYREGGVSGAELGRAVGVSGAYVRRITAQAGKDSDG